MCLGQHPLLEAPLFTALQLYVICHMSYRSLTQCALLKTSLDESAHEYIHHAHHAKCAPHNGTAGCNEVQHSAAFFFE
jgi:hypothetical protein